MTHMLRSWRIGRAFGIPLYVNPTFLILPLLAAYQFWPFGWGGILFGEALLVAVFTCVVLHELGHALMARYFAIPTRDITLYPIGGVARLERMSDTPLEELLIAVAGPAVNVVIVILLVPVIVGLGLVLGGWPLSDPSHLGTARPAQVAAFFLMMLGVTNTFLVLFNMIPAFPMDGGRVLRALLAMGLGLMRATEIAAALGLVAAGLLALAAVLGSAPMLFVVAVFVAIAGQAELRALRYREAVQARQQAERQAGVRYGLPAQPRPSVPVPSTAGQDVETVVLRSPGIGEPARPEPSPLVELEYEEPAPQPQPARRGGFTGLVWDRERQVWVKWVDGRPVAAYWGQA